MSQVSVSISPCAQEVYPVDESCPANLKDKVHVHQHGGDVLWCTLNLTDLATNSNKYYVAQVLKHNKMNSYFITSRSGRIGSENKTGLKCYLDETKVVEEFKNIFHEKTGYVWSDRHIMTKKNGKYDYVELHTQTQKVDNFIAPPSDASSSGISADVEEFIRLIFDIKIFDDAMKKMNIDTKKAPLGQISKGQIKKAFTALTQIQTLLAEGVTANDPQYVTASSLFYSCIPTYTRNQKPPLINAKSIFEEKTAQIEILDEMELSSQLVSKTTSEFSAQYTSLGTDIKLLKDTKMIDIIKTYMHKTAGSTHRFMLSVKKVYEIDRLGETVSPIANHQLLWHGTRLANYVGILSKGLRIAPPEAPSTGHMFGKGVYFSNCVTKAGQYMYSSDGIGVMLLCEVALGACYRLKNSTYITKLPAGYQSTWGTGGSTTNPKEFMTLTNGTIVPSGNLISAGFSDAALLYDEFIVYDISQVKIRYAVVVDVGTK